MLSADAASEPHPAHATVLRTPPDVLPLAAANLASEFLIEPRFVRWPIGAKGIRIPG
jgi:hypothetical protein